MTARRSEKQKSRAYRRATVCLVLFLSLVIFGIVLYLLCIDVGAAYRPVTTFSSDSTGLSLPIEPLTGEIDINSATAEELQALPGIGSKYSESIVVYRQRNGGFLYPEELLEISGIAEKRYAILLPYITLGDYIDQPSAEEP